MKENTLHLQLGVHSTIQHFLILFIHTQKYVPNKYKYNMINVNNKNNLKRKLTSKNNNTLK